MKPTARTTPSARNDDGGGADAIVADYRERLRRATADLPGGRRAELLDDIDAHLAEATARASDEATVRQALDDLGTPEAIADAARAESGTVPARPGDGDRLYDVSAVLVLLVGGFVVPVVGWLAGLIMVWNGPRWTTAQKWLGTLAWPVAIALPVAVALLAARTLHPSPAHSHWLLPAAGLVGLGGLVWTLEHLLRAAARRRA